MKNIKTHSLVVQARNYPESIDDIPTEQNFRSHAKEENPICTHVAWEFFFFFDYGRAYSLSAYFNY